MTTPATKNELRLIKAVLSHLDNQTALPGSFHVYNWETAGKPDHEQRYRVGLEGALDLLGLVRAVVVAGARPGTELPEPGHFVWLQYRLGPDSGSQIVAAVVAETAAGPAWQLLGDDEPVPFIPECWWEMYGVMTPEELDLLPGSAA